MSSEIYRGTQRFRELADNTHRRYLPGKEDSDPPDYSQRIPIGRSVLSGDVRYMTLRSSDRIGIFGRTGDGKTTLSKRILSGSWLGGMKWIHLSDVKNDFHDIDNKGGVSQQLIRDSAGLAPGEEPQPIPKKMFVPKLLANEYRDLGKSIPYYLETFTYSIEDLSRSDFMALFADQDTSGPQRNILSDLFLELEEPSFDGLERTLESLEANKNAKEAVQRTIETVRRKEVLGYRFSRYNDDQKDLVQYLDDHVVALSLEHWDRFKRGGIEQLEIYIAITLRLIKEALLSGSLDGPIMLFIDEAHAFCPASGDSISRDDIIDMIDLGRAYDVPMLFSTQRPSQLPEEDVVDQMSHFFISNQVPKGKKRKPGWKALLDKANLYRAQHGSQNFWRKKFSNMEQYQWMMVDKKESTYDIIELFAPLCAHTG